METEYWQTERKLTSYFGRCHREGSSVWHRGIIYFTNFRILVVNQLDRDLDQRQVKSIFTFRF